MYVQTTSPNIQIMPSSRSCMAGRQRMGRDGSRTGKNENEKKNIFSYEIRDFSIVETTMIKHIHTYTLATTGTTIVN